MNIKQAKNIPIREVMESFSLFPKKENDRVAFYFALDREENTPSLSINFIENTAFDYGTGKKYDNISIIQTIKKCSVTDALQYLSGIDYSYTEKKVIAESGTNFKIVTIKDLQHPALIQYLRTRKITLETHYLREIHYEISGKKYFAIAFENNSGGFEIRNKYAKLCLGKKDITFLKSNAKRLLIFEGFLDFISFKILSNSGGNEAADYIILNSISQIYLLRKLEENYEKIELYLDNDHAGDKGTNELRHIFPNAEDKRYLYGEFKDINDFLISK
ncbi:toprim domain-containing protein [Chryseobacterium culicis]|nr:toprim domain-containing protein [Chryseobacterium culicis]